MKKKWKKEVEGEMKEKIDKNKESHKACKVVDVNNDLKAVK